MSLNDRCNQETRTRWEGAPYVGRPVYEITSERFVNEEGSEFVTVTISWPGTEAEEERTLFASYFDDLAPSATEQAASFVAAFEESQEYSLEERLGPYGLEWEREQDERRGGGWS